MSNIWSRLINLAGNITGILPVANGGTALSSGTSGGVLAYTATGTLASSALLAAGGVVYGGGAGVVPATTAAGSASQVLIGGTVPVFGNVPAASLPAIAQSTAGVDASSGQRLGTNTNDAGSAGNIGEQKIITNSLAGTTANYATSAAMSITAGDWDVYLNIDANNAGGTATAFTCGISTDSGTTFSDQVDGLNKTQGTLVGGRGGAAIPAFRVSISAAAVSTNYYAKLITFTANATLPFTLKARRVR